MYNISTDLSALNVLLYLESCTQMVYNSTIMISAFVQCAHFIPYTLSNKNDVYNNDLYACIECATSDCLNIYDLRHNSNYHIGLTKSLNSIIHCPDNYHIFKAFVISSFILLFMFGIVWVMLICLGICCGSYEANMRQKYNWHICCIPIRKNTQILWECIPITCRYTNLLDVIKYVLCVSGSSFRVNSRTKILPYIQPSYEVSSPTSIKPLNGIREATPVVNTRSKSVDGKTKVKPFIKPQRRRSSAQTRKTNDTLETIFSSICDGPKQSTSSHTSGSKLIASQHKYLVPTIENTTPDTEITDAKTYVTDYSIKTEHV